MFRALFLTAGILSIFPYCSINSASAEAPSWRQLVPNGRIGHAVAFDRDRGVLVLFGGRLASAERAFDDTWECMGAHWARRSTSGPGIMAYPSMAYDEARRQTVMFAQGETWTWNGARWTQQSALGPDAGPGHAMCYDSGRAVVVLVGDDGTWEWNGRSWALRSTFASPATTYSRTALAYDRTRDRTVIHLRTVPQTWEWDGREWKLTADGTIDPSVPDGQSCVMVFDERIGRTVLIEYSLSRTGYYTMWTWDGHTWIDGYVSRFEPRFRTEVAYDSARGVVIAHGTDFTEWDGQQWTARDPGPRAYHRLVYDQARGETILYGGYPKSYVGFTYLGDTWAFTSRGWVRRATEGPGPRVDYGLAYDERRERVVLFGGSDETDTWRADTWEWDGTQWSIIGVQGPTGMNRASMAYDSLRDVLVLHVETLYSSADVAETWEWHTDRWVMIERTTDQDRVYSNLIFDPMAGEIRAYAAVSPILWRWTGKRWEAVDSIGPVLRDRFSMAYDKSRGCTVAYSRAFPMLQDMRTWEWNGEEWAGSAFISPGELQVAAMSFDAGRRQVIMHGGSDGSIRSEFWAYGIETQGDADFDGDVDLSDFMVFSQCFGGADQPPAAGCPDPAVADLDQDGDVDTVDFSLFARLYSGPQ